MIVLIEAAGSLTSGYLINAIQQSGNKVVGSDISDFNHGKSLCDDFIVVPKSNDPELWNKTLKLLQEKKVDVVIPSLDETMLEWSNKVEEFAKFGIKVIVSPPVTIGTFQDKWETFNFFKSIGIPTPDTSLDSKYQIIKPRFGRGGSGIYENDYKQVYSMEGMISQEKIEGDEYTVDVLFDVENKPVYIVPRKRLCVKDGKSTKGIVVKNLNINEMIVDMAKKINFLGPINFQLFETKDKELIFIEVNPRIAGGMALGFAATENWISVIVDNIVNGKKVTTKEIKYGLKMVRYYDECFI